MPHGLSFRAIGQAGGQARGQADRRAQGVNAGGRGGEAGRARHDLKKRPRQALGFFQLFTR